MPRILTPRELTNVEDLIDSKMWYWNIALGITDIMRENPRYAEKTRRKMENNGQRFDLASKVNEYVETADAHFRQIMDCVLDRSPRFWKFRFMNAFSATALSQTLTVEKVKGVNRWPDHVALFALKEIGRTLAELREERDIPEPCEDESSMAEYLHNIDPLEPLARYGYPYTTLQLSDAMITELMDNPEGIDTVLFSTNSTLTEMKFRIVAWAVTEEENWWEVLLSNGCSRKYTSHVLRMLLSSSDFVLQ